MTARLEKTKRYDTFVEEKFLLPVQWRIKSFIEDSKEKQTLYANCEGIYHRRVADVNDTDFLDCFISCTLFDHKTSDLLNLLSEERSLVTKMRNEIIKTARSFNTPGEIHFTVVWVHYFDYLKCDAEAMPLFKVFKTKNSHEAIFLDVFQNIYDGWENYLDNPCHVKSFICVPRNGTYVFHHDSGMLDLVYVFSKGSNRVKPLLPVKGKFMPFSEKFIRPMLSFFQTSSQNHIKKFVGFVAEILSEKKLVVAGVILVVVVVFVTYNFRDTESMRNWYLVRKVCCMLLNKFLTLEPDLVRLGESATSFSGENQNFGELFGDFLTKLDYDEILQGLFKIITGIIPAVSPNSILWTALNTIDLVIKPIVLERSSFKGKDFPALDVLGDIKRILPLENCETAVDNKRIKLGEEIFNNITQKENEFVVKNSINSQGESESGAEKRNRM